MKRLTTINSALISFWILLALSCSTVKDAEQSSLLYNSLHLEDNSRYRVQINTTKGNFTGIMLLKQTGNDWRGSLINEFGMKAFDIEANNGKCKLRNTMSMLNKWYIRKTIESDISFLLYKANKGLTSRTKKIQYMQDETFTLINHRWHIEYNFQPIRP